MEKWKGRVAVVTGASAGIGYATARLLAKHGMTVIGCSRNTLKIEEMKKESFPGNIHAVRCDVRNENEILDMFQYIDENFSRIDVLVNNAGLAHCSPLISGATEDWRDMLEVNVLALCVCTREALKLMKKRNIDDGHIIHISSMSGHRVIASPNTHFYAATKFALRALNEGLRNELRIEKSNIRTTEISPGLVDTEFQQRAGLPSASANLQALEADDVAESVVYALSAPAHVQIHDILMRPTAQSS